ncbi:MAG: molybdopterin cofactor-binding domain-containing protein [Pseudomonadota bacterium]
MPEISFTLDGQPITIGCDAGASALDLLRDHLDATNLKRACGQGTCGACTAIIDGKARPTCTLPATSLAGRTVLTTRGLSEGEKALYTRAFADTGGSQCGFCTPGLVLRTKALLDAQPHPDEAAIRRALGPHVCRCTGWQGVIRAVKHAAELRTQPHFPKGMAILGIGDPSPRRPSRPLVLGEHPFIADRRAPGMLHGALVFVPAPRCRLLRVHASAALALPGVRAVLTAADVPGEPWQGQLRPDWPPLLPIGAESGCSGDVAAAVAAESRAIAREAALLVRVEVEELEPELDLERAAAMPEMVLARTEIRRGDVDAALAASAVVVRETFHTQRQDHAFLEPEASLAEPLPEGRLRVLSCGQGIFEDRRALASFLGLAEGDIEVEQGGAGGAFGGREDLNVQPHAALLALRTGQPVLVELSMEESLRFHPKRHPMRLSYTLGADAEGRITALEAEILGDTGGHASVGEKVLERAAGHAGGPYHIPCAHVVAITVRTHNPTSGAMRGFGANQAAFALEGCLERIAVRLGLDPFEIRLRNAARPGDRLVSGQIVPSDAGQVATLEAIRPHYEAARAAGRAVGLACGLKNVGLGNGHREQGRVLLEPLTNGQVAIHTGFTEMGQGHDTFLQLAAATVTGLLPARFLVRTTTAAPVDVGMTTSSRATSLAGQAVRRAGADLRVALEQAGWKMETLVGRRFLGVWEAPETHAPDDRVADPVIHWSYAWATQLAILDERGRLERIVAAHDVGRALNPLACRGQVEGGVHMGVGWALCEELRLERGVPDTSYRHLGVLAARHTPEVEVLLVEVPAEHGPWGAKGIGEICLVPTAPAIAHAIHAFDGSWPTSLPMRDSAPERALRARQSG